MTRTPARTEGTAGLQPPSRTELMVAAAARQLADTRICFVGIGLPNIACNVAKQTVAPDLQLVYEAGVLGAEPARMPLSIGDPTLVSGALSAMSMFELFAYYLQRGLIEVGFLAGAQIDRFGSLNTTVIGEYGAPKVRLPGSGGACDIALNARRVFVVMRQSTRSFVPRLDFRTSPGHVSGRRPEGGPDVVVTDLGVYGFDDDGVMELRSLHPGVTLDEVREATGWEIKVAPTLDEASAPSREELLLVRRELRAIGRDG